MDSFLTMSSTRGRLFLFTIEDKNNLYFYSSPQPHISDESTCLVVPTTRYHVQQKQSLGRDRIYPLGSPFPGFVYMERRNTMVIWNPVTGDSVSLPKPELKGKAELKFPRNFNDPVDKQSKVVFMSIHIVSYDEHHLLTLDNENHLWRTPQCKSYNPRSNGIGTCIDGVVYYTAERADTDSEIEVFVIVCFHVSSEEFSFINIDEVMASSTLINYKGKLALTGFIYPYENPRLRLQFCVLEDAEKKILSKRIYTLPLLLSDNILNINNQVDILGMNGTGDELVLFMYPKEGPIYMYYLNLENNRITRVQIQGLEVLNGYRIHTTLDYVESFINCARL